MSKITPGKWKWIASDEIRLQGLVAGDTPIIVIATAGRTGSNEHEHLIVCPNPADKRLIEVAPELLSMAMKIASSGYNSRIALEARKIVQFVEGGEPNAE